MFIVSQSYIFVNTFVIFRGHPKNSFVSGRKFFKKRTFVSGTANLLLTCTAKYDKIKSRGKISHVNPLLSPKLNNDQHTKAAATQNKSCCHTKQKPLTHKTKAVDIQNKSR
ncbi:MAG: hypothetical protein IJ642_02275 [Oscillospiraceae bacterium]|nr:hypothetical protein [Oscillospiraceae bacterium]